MMALLEEFGDYLLARGRILQYRVKEEGRFYTRNSLIGMVPVKGRPNDYIEVTEGAVQKVLGMAQEDLPRALLESTNRMVIWYIEEKLKEA
jgi:hypothetical protein